MQQGFGILLLAEEVTRARREAALDIERQQREAREHRAAGRPRAASVRRLSLRLPRVVVTLTLTTAGRAAGAK